MKNTFLRSGRLWVCAVLGLAGCAVSPTRPVDRYADASACVAEMAAGYEGRTHAELLKIKDAAIAQRFRRNGHRYKVILMVQSDVEHQPDGLQASFTAFDDDSEPTFSPMDRTYYVRAGERLKVAE